MEIDNKLYARATEWLARLHADGQPDWNDPQLSKWLEQSEDHRLAFAEVSAYWFAAEERSLELDDELIKQQLPVPARWQRFPIWSGAIFALAIVAWMLAPFADSLIQGIIHDYHAPDGQVQLHTMVDGSVISLGGNTSIDIDFSADGRHVTLHQGEAFFDVKSDPNRPFTVRFATADVRVLGTHFGIIASSDESLIGVVQGRVDAGQASSGQRSILSDQELVVVSDSGLTADPRPPAEVFAWTEGQLVFEQQTLKHILRRMDRYFAGRILLLSEPKNNRRFSLVVSLGNASQALDTLAEQAGLKKLTLAGMTVLY